MPERIAIYRYEARPEGAPPETRWSFAPTKAVGYAGNDEPSDAHPFGTEDAGTSQMQEAGHVEAPDGSQVVSLEPPMLDIPGRGAIDLLALIDPAHPAAKELGSLVRWVPK